MNLDHSNTGKNKCSDGKNYQSGYQNDNRSNFGSLIGRNVRSAPPLSRLPKCESSLIMKKEIIQMKYLTRRNMRQVRKFYTVYTAS